MTLSIVARDNETGFLGLAQATNPLAVASRTAFVRANIAAVSTQAGSNPALGPIALDRLAAGMTPERTLLELRDTDEWWEKRQVGIVDALGRSAVHTGSETRAASKGVAFRNVVVMGNLLTSDDVVEEMARAWFDSREPLFERKLLEVLRSGRDVGGDRDGHRSASLIVYDRMQWARTDLRVDFVPKRPGAPDSVDTLSEILSKWEPLIDFYRDRPWDPTIGPWREWLREKKGIEFQD
jgi:uncharacterized Ntn-hydrolase superfamily protein